MQQQQGVVLRIKRRRDVQAPEQIVLEATSRTSALLSEFQRSVNIESDSNVISEAQVAAGPPTKRCRFVLLKQHPQDVYSLQQQSPLPPHHHHQQQQQQAQWLQPQTAGNVAAAAGLSAGNRVLDLWHSAGLSYRTAAAAGGDGRVMGDRAEQQQQADVAQQQQQQQQQQRRRRLSRLSAAAAAAAAGNVDQFGPTYASAEETNIESLGKGILYEDMVQQYLQQQQHDPAAAAASVQQTHKPPSKRAAKRCATGPAAVATDSMQPKQAGTFSAQQQQQSAYLPDNMTRDTLLRQVPLSPQATQLMPPAAAAAAAGEAAQGGSSSSNTMLVDDSEDPEYVYDVYVPVYDCSMDADTDLHQQQQQQQGSERAAATVVQIWEEDLVGFEDLWTVPLGTTGAADEEEEDSNAEDYYANDYPDDEDHHNFETVSQTDSDEEAGNVDNLRDDSDSSDVDDEHLHKLSNTHTNLKHNSLITCYIPPSNKSSNMPAGVNDGADTEEYDINDYESSGDEEQLQGWYNSGAAWRAVLAEQCMPPDCRLDAAS